MKYRVCINGRYCNPALLKHRNQQAQAQASVVKLTSDKLKRKRQASRRDDMKKKCTGWAIVTTMEREDGTWYTETITDVDDDTASSVDNFLTEYCEEKDKEK